MSASVKESLGGRVTFHENTHAQLLMRAELSAAESGGRSLAGSVTVTVIMAVVTVTGSRSRSRTVCTAKYTPKRQTKHLHTLKRDAET